MVWHKPISFGYNLAMDALYRTKVKQNKYCDKICIWCLEMLMTKMWRCIFFGCRVINEITFWNLTLRNHICICKSTASRVATLQVNEQKLFSPNFFETFLKKKLLLTFVTFWVIVTLFVRTKSNQNCTRLFSWVSTQRHRSSLMTNKATNAAECSRRMVLSNRGRCVV